MVGGVELELIARQGVFSARDALRAGIDGRALSLLCHRSVCTRLTHGWYAVGVPDSQRDRHRLTAIALSRAYEGAALPSHSSVLVLLDLPLHGVDLATVHLTRLPAPDTSPPKPWSGQSRRRAGLLLHRGQDGVDHNTVSARPGLPLTVPVAHAVVGAGLVGRATGALVAADAALARGLVTRAELDGAIAAFDGHRGVGPVRAALRDADGRHESPGESLAAHVLAGLGHELQPQFEVVAEGRTYRADFRIAGTRVLVEFDGRVKYESGDRAVLFEEKRREDALRRAGWVVVRLVWSDLTSPDLVRARIQRALGQAAAAA
jgi:very-short-patch-repair endonuclease